MFTRKLVVNHGDLIIYPVKKFKPPKEAKKSTLHVLQESGTTGNRHEVISKKSIYRWTKNGIEYIHSDVDYSIQHVGGDCEHGVQPIQAGTCEVRHELEHDPWKNELKKVID